MQETEARVEVTRDMLVDVFKKHPDMFKTADKSALNVYASTVFNELQKEDQ